MANEASIIANPTSTPAAVSTGYQAQNTRFIAQANGLDCSVIEGGAGQVTVKISGPVDVNGVLYAITADAVLAIGGGAGNYIVYLDGVGNLLTPTITATPGDFDPTKNAHYTAGGKRILDWLIQYDGATAKAFKIGRDNFEDKLVANGTWTAPFSKVYEIWVTGKGGNGGSATKIHADTDDYGGGGGGGALTGKIRKFIEAGTIWTAVFSAASGGNTTFGDGITALSSQNGYSAAAVVEGTTVQYSIAGLAGIANSGFDISFGGNDGSYILVGLTDGLGVAGHGGNSMYGGGGYGGNWLTNTDDGENGKAYGAGGGGGFASLNAGTGNGGTGASGLIRIIG
jgi:hypothetical protein